MTKHWPKLIVCNSGGPPLFITYDIYLSLAFWFFSCCTWFFKRLPLVTPWLHIWIPPALWEETWLYLKAWTYDMNQGLLSISRHLGLLSLYYIGCSTLLEIGDCPENKQLWGRSCPYQENCLKPAQKAKCFLTCDQSHPDSWWHGLLSDLRAVVVQSLSRVRVFVSPWTAARQASLSIINSQDTQTHVHWIGDTIQPSHPLSSPSPSTPVKLKSLLTRS